MRQKRREHPAALNAIKDAEQNLREVKSRAEEVSAVAKQTRELRIRNHFADQITQMMVPRPRKRA